MTGPGPLKNEVFVPETGQDVARRLLKIAFDYGYPPLTVRVNEFGFMVPAEVARIFHGGEPSWTPPAAGEYVPPPRKLRVSDPEYWTPERRKQSGDRLREVHRRRKEAAASQSTGGN